MFEVDGVRIGIVICEDIWYPGPAAQARAAGARGAGGAQRVAVAHAPACAAARAGRGARPRERGMPVVYVNRVGGQDELVFDGASFVVDADGALAQQVPAWHEALALVAFDGVAPQAGPRRARSGASSRNVYQALVMGVRDYVGKNRFPGVMIGLSGGVDSALTLAVAVDALGPAARARGDDAVAVQRRRSAWRMRGRWPASCGVRYDEIPIEPPFDAFLDVAGSRVSRVWPPTPPRRTSRRASAARC